MTKPCRRRASRPGGANRFGALASRGLACVLVVAAATQGMVVAAATPAMAAGTPALGDYLAASVALHDNDYPYAAEHLLRALAADPGNRSVRSQAFLAAALAGRPEATRLATGLAGDSAAALLDGNALAIAGRWGEAAHVFATAPSDNGLVDMLRPLLVAWSDFGDGHPELALDMLEPLESASKLPGLYALHAATIADLAGRAEDAATSIGLVRTRSPLPGLDAVRIVASYEARHGRLGDAEALIHALATDEPALGVAEADLDASLMTRPISDARDGLAASYLAVAALIASQSDASATALLLVRYALSLDPGLTAARLLASDLDQSLHVPDAGLAVLAPVGPGDPLETLVALRRAELEQVLGHVDAARAAYLSLADARPGVAEPWRELGEMLSDAGRNQEAIDAFGHAIADTPASADGSWQLDFDRAVALDRMNRWAQAKADLDEALRRSPDQPYVLNYIGYSDAERDVDLEQARALVERALATKPRDPAFLDSLGWIMLKQNDVGDGVRTLEAAAEMTPDDPTVNYHLGVGYWRQNRHAEAEQEWQKALILQPDAADRPRIEARLREAASDKAGSAGAGSDKAGSATASHKVTVSP